MSGETSREKGKTEGLVKRGLFILGGLAVAAIVLPPVGAAVATKLAGLKSRVGR